MQKAAMYIGGVCLALALCAVVGMGVWIFQLDSNLVAAQRELASQQSKNTQLASTGTQAKSDLAKCEADLTAGTADKSDLETEKAALQSKLESARQLAAVLDGVFVTPQTDAEIEQMVNATKDVQLIQFWDEARSASNLQSATVFISYLVKAIGLALK